MGRWNFFDEMISRGINRGVLLLITKRNERNEENFGEFFEEQCGTFGITFVIIKEMVGKNRGILGRVMRGIRDRVLYGTI